MQLDPEHPLSVLRRDPRLAFDLARAAGRDLPALRASSITRIRGGRAHTGLDGVRRILAPDLAFVAKVARARDHQRGWALLVDLVEPSSDPERMWAWPFITANLRAELGLPTVHLVIVTGLGLVAGVQAAFAAEPDLLPLVVGWLARGD